MFGRCGVPFVFSSSAEILAFCPGDQCLCTCFPLRLSPLRGPPAGTSIAWHFSGHSRKVAPLTLVFHKTPASTLLCPLSLSLLRLSLSMSCFILFYFILFYFFIYLFFFHSFTPPYYKSKILRLP